MKTTENPKVFVSHASEDKERFVVDFATKLRSNGVDAWVDQWEIHLGDSLIDKIFEQGISEADAFIIVLSHHSVQKPWVQEELNTAAIKRIEENTKVIPVIIDRDVTVPEVLKNTVWETIEDINSCEDSLKKILSSIYGVYEKPELGNAPAYAVSSVQVEGLSSIDFSVFKALGDEVFLSGSEHLEQAQLGDVASQLEISDEEMNDSLEILENEYLLIQTKVLSSRFPMIQLNYYGVLKYAEHFIENFPSIHQNIIALIINGEMSYSKTYAEKLNCSEILTSALLEYFDSQGCVKTHTTMPSGIGIFDVTASGKRYFREQLEKIGV